MTTPLSPTEAVSDVERLRGLLPVVHPAPGVVDRALGLVRVLGHSGRHIFDLVLAATMLESGIRSVVTYDDHFGKVPGLVAVTPEQLR
jgi:predicted nucleic acid-binding protein